MKNIKPFKVFEAKSESSAEDDAKALNDIVEPALFGLIEDYDPMIDCHLRDNRYFVLQFMFAKKNKKKRDLDFSEAKEFIADTEYLLGAYKHIYTVMRKIVEAGYECTLNHDNGDANVDSSPGPYYISLITPRKGQTNTSEIEWLIEKKSSITINKTKLADWLSNYSQAIEDIDYEENDGTVDLKIEIGGIGFGGEVPTARQVLKMEKQLKTSKRITDINIQDTKITLEFQLKDGETFKIN